LSVHLAQGKRGYSVGAGYLANVPNGKGGYRLAESDGTDGVRTVQALPGTFAARADADKHFDGIVSQALAGIWTVRGSKSGSKLSAIPGAGTVAGTTEAPKAEAPKAEAPKADTDTDKGTAGTTEAPKAEAPKADTDTPAKGTAAGTTRVHPAKGTVKATT
jgi:hypothetical protein